MVSYRVTPILGPGAITGSSVRTSLVTGAPYAPATGFPGYPAKLSASVVSVSGNNATIRLTFSKPLVGTAPTSYAFQVLSGATVLTYTTVTPENSSGTYASNLFTPANGVNDYSVTFVVDITTYRALSLQVRANSGAGSANNGAFSSVAQIGRAHV